VPLPLIDHDEDMHKVPGNDVCAVLQGTTMQKVYRVGRADGGVKG